MKKIEEVVKELTQNPMLTQVKGKQQNNAVLGGFILRQPKFIIHDKTGVESCSLLLYQLNQTKGNTSILVISVVTYVKDIIEELKKINQVTYVTFLGKLGSSKKIAGTFVQAMAYQKEFELDIELAEPWGSAKKEIEK